MTQYTCTSTYRGKKGRVTSVDSMFTDVWQYASICCYV